MNFIIYIKNKIYEKKFNLFSILIIIFTLFLGIKHSQFINDGYHWGFIFANSLDFNTGKTPYSEIFLEYGILQVIINSIIFEVFGKKLIYIQIFILFSYSLGVYIVGSTIYQLTKSNFYKFLSIFIILSLYPWPVQPWPNFLVFLFSSLFIYFYLKNNLLSYAYSGFFLSLSYLSYTTLSNIYIGVFFLFIINCKIIRLLCFKEKFFEKSDITWVIFFVIIISYILYIILFVDLNIWILYQKIPFVISESLDNSKYLIIKNYIYYVFIHPFESFLFEPQFLLHSIFLITNIIYIPFYIFTKDLNKNKNFLTILVFIFCINIFSLSTNYDYTATSAVFGIITLFYLIDKIYLPETRLIVIFYLIFISFFSILNVKMGYSKFSEGRYLKFKDIPYKFNKRVSQISLFDQNIWDEKYQDFLESLNTKINTLKSKCPNIYGVNYTDDSNIYNLLYNFSFQKIPFKLKDKTYNFHEIFDSKLEFKINEQIQKGNIFIISEKNIDKNIKYNEKYKNVNYLFDNKKTIKKIYKVSYPKKCN